MNKTIRWKQRFDNLARAYGQLQKGLKIKKPSDIEKQGIIQSFEFTFELSWKTLKDYLESRGVSVSFPRDVIKEAFHHNIISDGDVWLDMLGKRNLLAHTYDEEIAEGVISLIRKDFEPLISDLIKFFKKEND